MRAVLDFFTKTLCERKGHDWFPDATVREFIPLTDYCLRSGCNRMRVTLPYGTCMGAGGHPIRDHYDPETGAVLGNRQCSAPF